MKPLRQTDRVIEQSPRSWWLEAETRQDFTRLAELELLRMKASRAYTQGGSGMVVGQIKKR
jgi:hypothetical protein